MSSLRFRLLLALLLVAVIPVAIVATLEYYSTSQAFGAYTEAKHGQDASSVSILLAGQNVNNTAAFQRAVAAASAQIGERVIVVSSDGTIVGDSAGQEIGQKQQIIKQISPPPFVVSLGSSSSSAISATAPASETPVPVTSSAPAQSLEHEFLGRIARELIIAVLAAFACAVVLAILLSRQIVRPIEQLTNTALGIAGGRWQERVTIHSPDEIGQLAQAFNAMADARVRLDHLRRTMINDVAHELRTPISNLQGYFELFRDGTTPPTPETLALLHEESLLLGRLVADLQDLARADAGQLRLHRESLIVENRVLTALDSLRPRAEAKEVMLTASLPPDLPRVQADVDRLGQILRNLLSNAITHTPSGGSICVRATAQPTIVSIDVHDTGSGIPADHLPFVFERFYRVDPARNRASGGAGLGLAIVKQLVEAHGGTISVASSPAEGTTFRFTLPRADKAETAVASAPAQRSAPRRFARIPLPSP